jgi:1,2-diacylglycerol 3-alpha-glucosyltransferase
VKIAMFTDSFHPTVDGAVGSMERQCEGLERRGHEVVVIAPDARERCEYPRPVHYLPSTEFRSYKGYRIVVSPSDMLDYLRKERVDIVHCHGIASMAILSLTAARALELPHLLTFHTIANEAIKYYSFLGLREDLMVPLVWVYLRNMLRRPHVVIAPSRPVKDELVANGVEARSWDVIPTGVDCTRFSPSNRDPAILARHGLEGKRVMLHVGRLSHEKRLDIVLRGMAEIAPSRPDLRLLVAGSGPAEAHYRDLCGSLGLSGRVVFAGFMPDDELAGAYATCDMLVLASTFETQGLVVLEAMASGTPVAGMRFRAIPEFVKEGVNGCLFDEESCAEGMARCLDGLATLRGNTTATAKEHSVESCTAKLEKAYERATDMRNAGL